MRACPALRRPQPAHGIPLVLELKEQPAYADPAPASLALDMVRGIFEQIERQAEEAAE